MPAFGDCIAGEESLGEIDKINCHNILVFSSERNRNKDNKKPD